MVLCSNSDLIAESTIILEALESDLPKRIDGREAILELKESEYQWRQMEWIGWYIEYKMKKILVEEAGGQAGPSYGLTKFDYSREFIWDFKAHPCVTFDNRPNNAMILNDREAIERCISDHGGVGFVIASGDAAYDTVGDFKRWHDDLKGGRSQYEEQRIVRGARSRMRKISFHVQRLEVIFFPTATTLRDGLAQGWLTEFQEGMRNANGKPRRAKYAIRTNIVPDTVRPISPIIIEQSTNIPKLDEFL